MRVLVVRKLNDKVLVVSMHAKIQLNGVTNKIAKVLVVSRNIYVKVVVIDDIEKDEILDK